MKNKFGKNRFKIILDEENALHMPMTTLVSYLSIWNQRTKIDNGQNLNAQDPIMIRSSFSYKRCIKFLLKTNEKHSHIEKE